MGNNPCERCRINKSCSSHYVICKRFIGWFVDAWNQSCERIADGCGKDIQEMRDAVHQERSEDGETSTE